MRATDAVSDRNDREPGSAVAARRPLVSLVTPAHNAGPYIAETVESVLAQDYPELEYIVLDDGSTDDTLARLAPYQDRVTIVGHANLGEQRTVNKGVELARGDFVAVINADDPIMPGLVAAAVETLSARPELVGVYPDWLKLDSRGRVLDEVRTCDFDYALMLAQHYCIIGPGGFFRRSALNGEPIRDPAFRYAGDFDFWLRLGLHGPLARIPRTLATWRMHEAGASHAKRDRQMARDRIAVMEKLFARPDLPAEIRALRRQALSAAHYAAGIMAIHNPSIPGRRYLMQSIWYKPLWPAGFLPQQRRSWLRIAYVLGQPATGLLYKRAALRHR